MKYLSLFSGIGGFEVAIHNVYTDAVCVGYSEIDKFAIKVYEHHFPSHKNIGSITELTEKDIKHLVETYGGIDLIVGGFPCQNLSSLSRNNQRTGNSDGLNGPKSRLFWNMVDVLKWTKKYNPYDVHVLIENNASMSKDNRQLITTELSVVFPCINLNILNGSDFGVQTRKRIYWTTFPLDTSHIVCTQTWDDVLIDDIDNLLMSDVQILGSGNRMYESPDKYPLILKKRNDTMWNIVEDTNMNGITLWQKHHHSSTKCEKSRTITRSRNVHNCIFDYRTGIDNAFYVRYFDVVEVERLFYLPDNWVSTLCKPTRSYKLLGNCVIVKVIEYILRYGLLIHN